MAEPDAGWPRAELFDPADGPLALLTTFDAMQRTWRDWLACFTTSEGPGVWVAACR